MVAPFVKGVGQVRIRTIDKTNNILVPLFPFSVEYARDVTSIPAKGQVNGTLSTLASAPGETTDTLTLSTQYADWATLGFFLNQTDKASTAPVIPVLKSALLPTTSPYEIADAAITTGTAPHVYASVSTATGGIEIRTMTSGSVAAGQLKADGSAGKLVGHASDAGKLVYYQVPISHDDTKYYGGDNTESIGTFELFVKTFPDENIYWYPSCAITTAPTISASGTDASTYEIQVTPNIPLSLGFTLPYQLWKRPVEA